MKYQVIAPRVGEMSQLYRVVKIETGETLYSSSHYTNADQVCAALERGEMSEDITVSYLYFGDALLGGYKDIYEACRIALQDEGRDGMDTPKLTYKYFIGLLEDNEIGDWRIVEEEDLDIILGDYIEE